MLNVFIYNFKDMTGLTQKTSEAIQVQNYEINRWTLRSPLGSPNNNQRTNLCWDWKSHSNVTFLRSTYTRRIIKSTSLNTYCNFQLSDIEKGGAAIFPYIKVRIDAWKRAAGIILNHLVKEITLRDMLHIRSYWETSKNWIIYWRSDF